MLRCYAHAAGKLTEVAGPPNGTGGPDIVWLDMLDPSPEDEARVESYLGIPVPTRAAMAEIELSDRLYVDEGASYMTMTALAGLEGDHPKKAPVSFVLKDNRLVTVRHTDSWPFATFVQRVQRQDGLPVSNGEGVMLGLIEAIIDRTADALERVGDEVDGTSHAVFRTPASAGGQHDLQSVIEQIGRMGDLLTKIQESLVSLGRLMSFHTVLDAKPGKPERDSHLRVKLIQRDAAALGEHTNFLTGKVNFLLEATLGLINLEQNKIIKIFSVAAVVMLPPTLVASAYGMNFDFMPELHWTWGYPYALGLMVISAVVPYLYFKWRRWL